MQKRILMVHEGVLLELLKGAGPDCWFRKKELCMDCTLKTPLTIMCQENRRYLSLRGWSWKEVST